MRNNLLKSFFSSGLQAIAVQVLSILFFLLISLYLPKESFGIIVWANAVSVMITAFLSFGLEQVVTRRIAASSRSDWAAAAFLFHALAGSVTAFAVLLLLRFFLNDDVGLQYLPWFFLAQAIMYLATPLKQYLNAKQQFGPYGVIAVVSNVVKIATAFVLLRLGLLSIGLASIILILSASLEFVFLFIYIQRRRHLSFAFRKLAYFKLLQESLPLYLTAVSDVVLKRAGTLLLGFLSTHAITGDFGFAYRAFEMATLPVFIIGPVILAKFAKMSIGDRGFDEQKIFEIRHLFTVELFAAFMIPLVLNIIWSPVLDYFSNGKYGSANATVFLLLSVCVPLSFSTNLLWTLCFTRKMYKFIGMVTLVSAICNLVLNLLLISIWGGTGAAVAFIITLLVQSYLYYRKVRSEVFALPVGAFLMFFIFAAIALFISLYAFTNVLMQLAVALTIYLTLAILLKQVGATHVSVLRKYFRK